MNFEPLVLQNSNTRGCHEHPDCVVALLRTTFEPHVLQEMAQLVTDHMESVGTRFLLQCKAQKITRDADGRLVVTFINEHGETREDVFKTVLIATGHSIFVLG